MSAQRVFLVVLTAALLSMAAAPSSNAQSYWGTGTGNWSDSSWGAGSGGPYSNSWGDGYDAYFEGTAGTVTIPAGGNPTVNSLNFTASGYAVTGDSLTLSTGSITVPSSMTAAISSVIAGSAGLTLTSSSGGILILSGANTYIGPTTAGSGTLAIKNSQALGTGDLTDASWCGVVLDGNGLNVPNNMTFQTSGQGGRGYFSDMGYTAITSTGGNNTISGNVSIGTFAFVHDGSLNYAGTLNLAGTTWFGGATTIISGPITGSGALDIYANQGPYTPANPAGSKYLKTTVILAGDASAWTGALTEYNYSQPQQVNTFVLQNANCGSGAITYGGSGGIKDGWIIALQYTGAVTGGGNNYTARTLNLHSTGTAGTDTNLGGLRNLAGNNTWNGAITLTLASRINSDADTLTIANSITNSTFLLSVGGAGNTLITGAIGSGTGGLTKDGAGTLSLTGANAYTGTTTVAGGTLYMTQAAAQNTVLNYPTTGGTDISGGRCVLDWTGSTDLATTVPPILATGYAAGWTSGQFRCPTADASHGLGWTNNTTNDLFTIAYTLYGDANLDGTVNGEDLNTVLSNYNKTSVVWRQGDFNYDGTVNGEDLNTVLSNYNKVLGVSAAVPEPSTLLLTALGLLALFAFIRRKRH
jgi:autotransporter-associated beta strand protein